MHQNSQVVVRLVPASAMVMGLVLLVSRFCKLFTPFNALLMVSGCAAVNSASCSCMQQFSRINLKLQLLHLLTALCVRTLEVSNVMRTEHSTSTES